MREILRSNDPVLLNFAEALLRDAGLRPVVMDVNMSVLEGSIGVFPRRLIVPSSLWEDAARLLRDAGLDQWIIESPG